MRLVVRTEPLTRILKWAHRSLFACGALCLSYCGFALADAWTFQRSQSGAFDRLLRDRSALGQGTPRPEDFTSQKGSVAATDGLIGRIVIPRLLISAVVVEGIDRTSLRRAIGHIPGTALPGERGNVGLAGHRDTLFRPLRDVRTKDEIQFSSVNGDFKYTVESIRIVDPRNVEVLAPEADKMLTLVTCYPFSYIGPAPKRFVIRARQVSPTAGKANCGMMKIGRQSKEIEE